jgi:hypothetical protein
MSPVGVEVSARIGPSAGAERGSEDAVRGRVGMLPAELTSLIAERRGLESRVSGGERPHHVDILAGADPVDG